MSGKIVKVSGPLVVAEGMQDADMYDVAYVGRQKLIGEIIEMRGDRASIQVYEETAGLGPGDEVVSTGAPLSVELGPGLIENIYDGIQRPLEKIREMAGSQIARGVHVPALDREKKWTFMPLLKRGASVEAGDIVGYVRETPVVSVKIMVPYGVSGKITKITAGDYTVTDTVAEITSEDGRVTPVKLMQTWPVRRGRPYKTKLSPTMPM
ncbi:MAG: V-type ATP synthase subunit A, partial [Eubacteriales bacterium]